MKIDLKNTKAVFLAKFEKGRVRSIYTNFVEILASLGFRTLVFLFRL